MTPDGVERALIRQAIMVGAAVAAALEAQAAPVPLGEDELRTAVVGKTVKIDTPLGMPITVTYSANGLMTGTAGTALGVYLGATKDRGRWSIRDGKLCQKWFKWLDAETTCLSLQQDGLKILWRSDTGKTGTAVIEPGPPELSGATASGLGLPQPPVRAAEPAPIAAAPAPAPIPRPEPERAQSAQPAEAIAKRPEARPQRAAVVSAAPALVDQPRPALRPAKAVADAMVPPRLAFASLAPQTSGPAGSEQSLAAGPQAMTEVLESEAHTMRRAADLAAIAAIEHRWCSVNALGTGPAIPFTVSPDQLPLGALMATPSLVAVAHEQLYEGELPLYEAACLTERPALGALAAMMIEAR